MSTITRPYPSSSAIPSQAYNNQFTGKILAPLIVMTAGTGGVMTIHSAAELSRLIHNPLDAKISIEHSVPRKIDMRSPAEHVENIRSAFAISMSDLAVILGITRPTAYSWLKGDEPQPEAISRIQRLSSIADRVRKMNINRLDKLVHRPLSDGRSLFDVLNAEEDPTEVLSSLQVIAAKESQTRRKQKGSGRNLKSLDVVLDEFSVPIVFGTNEESINGAR